MAGRQPRNIRGPHSALTDFLESNNISAADIRDSYERRVADARSAEQNEGAGDQDFVPSPEAGPDPEPQRETPEEKTRKRKRQQAINKIKKSKEFARRKVRYEDYDDDVLAAEMMDEKQLDPGQLANCELCGKRFTVTAYSKTGPTGGLLCPGCSKKVTDGNKKSPPKKRPNTGMNRRQNRMDLLDGRAPLGARRLTEMCISKIVEKIDDVDEFGDLPPPLLHRISQILSRKRAMNPRVLNLFLRPEHKELNIYDCAYFTTDDYHRIIATMPNLTRLNLRFVTPMKDPVFQYMIDQGMKIHHLHLDAPNLVTDDCWRKLFTHFGPVLKSLKLWNLDIAFDDETVKILSQQCTELQRLKLKFTDKVGNGALEAIPNFHSLEHLSLRLTKPTTPEALLQVIAKVGPNLQSLSLEVFKLADDRLVQSIHDNCRHLHKLRLTDNNIITDKGLTALFQGWANPPLKYVDLHALRDLDMFCPAGPPEPVGLASDGFKALMAHSGSRIEYLKVASCRHIKREAFEEVFAEGKVYPALKYLDVAFVGAVDDYVAQCIFRCCPALEKIIVFGCFGLTDIRVPRKLAVIGTVRTKMTYDDVEEMTMDE